MDLKQKDKIVMAFILIILITLFIVFYSLIKINGLQDENQLLKEKIESQKPYVEFFTFDNCYRSYLFNNGNGRTNLTNPSYSEWIKDNCVLEVKNE
jgi:hypothetical protein